MGMDTVEIIGRSSSHFTRVTRIVAEELGVAYALIPIHDLTAVDPAVFAGNPALKLPTLRRAGALVFGAENICRALAELAGAQARVTWPEQLRGDVSRNAQELVGHGMAAQVQLVLGTKVGGLPAEHPFFAKVRAGFAGALGWLDAHLDHALAALPADRVVSMFEVTLFCLVDHLDFRATIALDDYPALRRFQRAFAARPSAARTPYRFDATASPP